LSKNATAEQILDILERCRHRNQDQWAFFRELRCSTGFKKTTQRLDAWAQCLWGDHERITYEVKVTRSDFLSEIRKPQKRKLGMFLSNLFFFVTPAGLVKPEEVPPACGLLTVNLEKKTCNTVLKPVFRSTGPPPTYFLAAVARRVQNLELASQLRALKRKWENRDNREEKLVSDKWEVTHAFYELVKLAREHGVPDLPPERDHSDYQAINWLKLQKAKENGVI